MASKKSEKSPLNREKPAVGHIFSGMMLKHNIAHQPTQIMVKIDLSLDSRAEIVGRARVLVFTGVHCCWYSLGRQFMGK